MLHGILEGIQTVCTHSFDRGSKVSRAVCGFKRKISVNAGKFFQIMSSPTFWPGETGWVGIGWDGMGWDGMGRGWDGIGRGWDGMGWDLTGWEVMVWDRRKWDKINRRMSKLIV